MFTRSIVLVAFPPFYCWRILDHNAIIVDAALQSSFSCIFNVFRLDATDFAGCCLCKYCASMVQASFLFSHPLLLCKTVGSIEQVFFLDNVPCSPTARVLASHAMDLADRSPSKKKSQQVRVQLRPTTKSLQRNWLLRKAQKVELPSSKGLPYGSMWRDKKMKLKPPRTKGGGRGRGQGLHSKREHVDECRSEGEKTPRKVEKSDF